ncbi:MAG: hypothetical protein GX587_04535 [Bacteroidales bacterium]|nr:hypothetical protein [Bacteroidales bacterium]
MKKVFLILALVCVFMTSCIKENLYENETTAKGDILKFNNFDDFLASYNEISSMDFIAAEAWANSHGYNSICAEVERSYFSIDFETIKSHEELQRIVNNHKDFFCLVYNEEGDLFVEPRHINNRLRYFANEDMMFEINNFICKLTENGIIIVEEQNSNLLESVNEQNIGDYSNDKKVKFISTSTGSIQKALKGQTCTDNYCKNEGFSGRNRVTVALELEFLDSWGQTFNGQYYHVPNHTIVTYSYSVKAHRKTDLGFYYIARRTLSADLKVYIDITTNSGTNRVYHRYQEAGKLGYGLTGSVTYYATPYQSGAFAPHTSSFGPINAWGDSPDVNYVYINCFN